jgi:hypothetical protein
MPAELFTGVLHSEDNHTDVVLPSVNKPVESYTGVIIPTVNKPVDNLSTNWGGITGSG